MKGGWGAPYMYGVRSRAAAPGVGVYWPGVVPLPNSVPHSGCPRRCHEHDPVNCARAVLATKLASFYTAALLYEMCTTLYMRAVPQLGHAAPAVHTYTYT